ncbi:MAG TPA: hypothetical protein VFD53_02475, partial [Ilumatobacter sp.]|nr:hypothetical protein [Ilumatobacter sp.]
GTAPDLVPETAPAPATDASKPEKVRRRRTGRLGRVLLALGAAAVLVLGFAIIAAWARSGYYVAYDEDGTVAIYQGRQGGFWWFEPTREAKSNLTRAQLDAESNALVVQELNFENRADAERFIAISLAVTTTTSTTTTTTVPTTIASPTTLAPIIPTPTPPSTGA